MPPAEAGLWDLGPFTGVWWVIVIVLWVRHRAQSEREPSATS